MHDTDIFSAVSSGYIIIKRRSYIIIFSIAIVTKALSLHIISTIFSILFDYLDVVLPVPDVDNLIVLCSHLAKKGNNYKASNIMVEF